MKLLRDLVLLERLPQATQTVSGIHVPQQYQDDRKQFIVVAVGPGRKLKDGTILPPEVKPGDRVLVNEYHGNRLALDDAGGRIIIEASQLEAKWGPGITADE